MNWRKSANNNNKKLPNYNQNIPVQQKPIDKQQDEVVILNAKGDPTGSPDVLPQPVPIPQGTGSVKHAMKQDNLNNKSPDGEIKREKLFKKFVIYLMVHIPKVYIFVNKAGHEVLSTLFTKRFSFAMAEYKKWYAENVFTPEQIQTNIQKFQFDNHIFATKDCYTEELNDTHEITHRVNLCPMTKDKYIAEQGLINNEAVMKTIKCINCKVSILLHGNSKPCK